MYSEKYISVMYSGHFGEDIPYMDKTIWEYALYVGQHEVLTHIWIRHFIYRGITWWREDMNFMFKWLVQAHGKARKSWNLRSGYGVMEKQYAFGE